MYIAKHEYIYESQYKSKHCYFYFYRNNRMNKFGQTQESARTYQQTKTICDNIQNEQKKNQEICAELKRNQEQIISQQT